MPCPPPSSAVTEPAATPASPGSRWLSRGITAASALVLLVFAGTIVRWPGESPLLRTEEPVRGLAVVAQRTLDLHEAAALAGPWEGAVYGATMGNRAHDLARAAEWYEELVTYTDAPEAELHLAVLEGELGRLARVRERVAHWRSETGPVDARAPLLEAAYLGGARPPVVAPRVAALVESLEEGWFRDRLLVRLGEAEGDPTLVERGRAATAARARRLLTRARALSLVDAALLAGGVVAAAVLVRQARRGPRHGGARAPIPPPWSGWTGATVLVRAGAAGLALVFLAGRIVEAVAPHPLVDAGAEALIAVPLVVLVRRHLFAPAGLGLAAGLGLRPGPGGWGTLLLASLGLTAAGLLLDLAVSLVGEIVDAEVHWAEWFEPALAWGGAADVAAVLVGAVVVAPVFEELAFRGVLYATLRRRLGVAAAAAVSSGVFAAAHGYGVTGLATVFASGVLWAWAYERTGSLLPGIAAHAASNLGVAVALLLLLRP